jgi:hypothetical protein
MGVKWMQRVTAPHRSRHPKLHGGSSTPTPTPTTTSAPAVPAPLSRSPAALTLTLTLALALAVSQLIVRRPTRDGALLRAVRRRRQPQLVGLRGRPLCSGRSRI